MSKSIKFSRFIAMVLIVAVAMFSSSAVAGISASAATKIKSITIPSKLTIGKGGTYKFKPTVNPSSKSSVTKKWSSSKSSVVYVSKTTGKITAKKVGKATITVKAGGKYDKCVVTVKKAPTKVSLNYTSKTLQKGAGLTLKPSFPSGSYSICTWATSNSSVATVSASGAVKAVNPGTATITVKTHNGKKTTCRITVPTPVVVPTALSFASAEVTCGGYAMLVPILTPANATTTYTWTSLDTGIASVDSYGNVLGVSPGQTDITARTANGITATCTVTVTAAYNATFESEVTRLCNIERAKVGVAPLVNSPELNGAAAVRATEQLQLFSHTRPDDSAWSTIFAERQIPVTGACGENIAAGYSTPAEVVDGWMHSPGHRENILRPSFKRLGVGHAYKDSDPLFYYDYWVQLFDASTRAE